MSNAQQIGDWVLDLQRTIRECPKVWAVYIQCDGEMSVDAVYESKEAAEMHRDWYNRKPRYFGRASLGPFPVRTLELARLLTGNSGE